MKSQFLFAILFAISWIINGPVIANEEPVAKPLQFRVWGSKADRNFEIPKNRKEIKAPYPQKEFYNKGKEYLINKVNYLLPVYSNSYIDDESNGELTACLSPGEYEPLTFAVHAQKDLTKCEVLILDLKDKNGNVISAISIDVRVVRGRPRLRGIDSYYLCPFSLESRNGIDIVSGTTQEYWLTVKAAEDIKPGIYKSILIFKPSNASPAMMNINLKVLPIHLAVPGRYYYMYYNLGPDWKGFYPGNLNKHLLDMREHGIDSVCVYIVPELVRTDGNLSVDMRDKTGFSVFSMEEFVAAYLRAGFNGPIINEGIDMAINYYIKNQFAAKPLTPAGDELITKLVEVMYRRQNGKRWPLMIMSPADEPSFFKERMELCRYYLRLIKSIDKNIVTAVTLNGAGRGVNDIVYFDPFLDIKICAYIDKNILRMFEESGPQLWLYNGGSFGKYPAVDRVFFGFYAEKVKAKGVGQWAYQWPHPSAKNESLYSELKYEQYGWYYTCPSSSGPLPTIGWEGVREGIDDARYIATLKETIKKARQFNDKDLLVLTDESEQYLHGILDKIPLNFHRQQGEEKANREVITCLNGNIGTLDVWRAGIADRIIKLLGTMNNLKLMAQ